MATNNSTHESVSYNNGTFISDTPGIIVNKSEVSSKIKEMNSSIDKESLKATIQAAKDSGVLIIETTNDDEILQLFIYVVNTGCKFGFNRTVTGTYVNSMIHRARQQIELNKSIKNS